MPINNRLYGSLFLLLRSYSSHNMHHAHTGNFRNCLFSVYFFRSFLFYDIFIVHGIMCRAHPTRPDNPSSTPRRIVFTPAFIPHRYNNLLLHAEWYRGRILIAFFTKILVILNISIFSCIRSVE